MRCGLILVMKGRLLRGLFLRNTKALPPTDNTQNDRLFLHGQAPPAGVSARPPPRQHALHELERASRRAQPRRVLLKVQQIYSYIAASAPVLVSEMPVYPVLVLRTGEK